MYPLRSTCELYRRGSVIANVIHLRQLMAAWHYHTKLLPLGGVKCVHGVVPSVIKVPRVAPESISRIDELVDQQPTYWSSMPDAFVNPLVERLSRWLPETESWSERARMFGDDLNDQCSIWLDGDGKLERIAIQFSLSNPNPINLKNLLGMPEISQCVILGIQSECLYEPSIANWTSDMLKCSAHHFLRGHDYFSHSNGG